MAGTSSTTFDYFGGAVKDVFSVGASHARATGQRIEAQEYDLAAQLARQNKQFTETSTEIKGAQQQRDFFKTMGAQQASIASAGFENSGSAVDLMRESASQGALAHGVLAQQGLIEEASFETQARSFDLMAQASRLSADESDRAADMAWVTAGIKVGAGIASLYTGGVGPSTDLIDKSVGGGDAGS